MTIAEALQAAQAHHHAGRLSEAEHLYRQILLVDPLHAEAQHLLGVLAQQSGQPDIAVTLIQGAIAVAPNVASFHNNLGAAWRDLGRLDEAVASYRRALALSPGHAMAHNNLGNALKEMGLIDESIAASREALRLNPGYTKAHSNLLLDLHYHPAIEREEIFREHLAWDAIHAAALGEAAVPHPNLPNPERRLRIGLVSADLHEHPVTYFCEGPLTAHDHDQFEIFCYADVFHRSAATERLRARADHWIETHTFTHEELARRIRADAIDILVDLSGHSARNRLLAFASKPAPVQVSYLGYCDTTGMRAMDYRLTDAVADQPGLTERFHTEALVRLPGTFACYRPPDDAPPVSALPALENGHVTFGSFHTLAKLNEPLLTLWATLLQRLPGARLRFAARGLDIASCRQRITDVFTRRGIRTDRLAFNARMPLKDYLSMHAQVDVLLDAHPFSGHTTACHALWMGVPVVTLAGRTHSSRMVASVLTALGRTEWIAADAEGYLAAACALAANLPRLEDLRTNLRAEIAASPVMDARSFARQLEQVWRELWRRWCESRSGPFTSP